MSKSTNLVRLTAYEATRFGLEPGTELPPWAYNLLREGADPGSYASVLAGMADLVVLDGLAAWASIGRHAPSLMPPAAVDDFTADVEHMRQVCVTEALGRGLPLLVDLAEPERLH